MIGFLAKILVTNRFTFTLIVVSEMVDLSGYVNIIELLGVLKRTFGGNKLKCPIHSLLFKNRPISQIGRFYFTL